jgi:glycosyltransferase involved in cell wall biosynthesis
VGEQRQDIQPGKGGSNAAPTVSVVIPLYNKVGQIASTLASVLDQDCPDFEVIVVNDGSTDGSDKAVAPFRDRIRYIEQDNLGASSARNAGIAASRGRNIAFQDADDLWLPGKLSSQVRFMDEHPDIMWSGVNESMDVYPPGGPSTTAPWQEGDADWAVLDDWFVQNRYRTMFGTPGVMIRREVIGEVGMFDPGIPAGQDMDMWIRIARRYPRYGFCFRPLVHVRNGLIGCLSLGGRRKSQSVLSFMRKYAAEVRRGGDLSKSFVEFVNQRLLNGARASVGAGAHDLARESLRLVAPGARTRQWWALWMVALVPSAIVRLLLRMRRALRNRIAPGGGGDGEPQ